ncbi:hypothetical protein [Mycolicibacterium sphagni]|uniref:Uncharacterized protein n=1 Tax=Mycolicibacterium sphagni TaxID=1786 RepID=A0ABX2JSX9_9MYCO|nr:hypothetical protein [Mycolicibacterium sphagni]NTY58595.1 hypothetical protein [Mycolicibacterium sphagni]
MGIADIALGAAPIAGGALLGVAAGNLRGPDVRGAIKDDIELLDKIPEENVALRAALRKSIDERIVDLITATEKSRELREIAASYKGNWRDIVVFVCAVLFTIVWWNVPHSRSNWLMMFIILIVLSGIVAVYASRGVIRAMASLRRSHHHEEA